MDGAAVISHRHRCIFVKVPKCASTSMREWFIAHAAGRHSFRPFWYPGALTERMQALARALDLYVSGAPAPPVFQLDFGVKAQGSS